MINLLLIFKSRWIKLAITRLYTMSNTITASLSLYLVDLLLSEI